MVSEQRRLSPFEGEGISGISNIRIQSQVLQLYLECVLVVQHYLNVIGVHLIEGLPPNAQVKGPVCCYSTLHVKHNVVRTMLKEFEVADRYTPF